ncbi:MAG: T9SS type A sorting domain-containing protein, partial [Caldithrix sp.]|nr:T9SS type A sorting domain-containing protein [Caldithrix sp.]
YDGHTVAYNLTNSLVPWQAHQSRRDTVQIDVEQGISGHIHPLIADPLNVTGHTYSIEFFEDQARNVLNWRLTDETTGAVRLDSVLVDDEEQPFYQVVDGIEWRVQPPGYGIDAIVQVADHNGPLPENAWDYRGRPYGGNAIWYSIGRWESANFGLIGNESYYPLDQLYQTSDDSVMAYQPHLDHDYEIRFEGPQSGIWMAWKNGNQWQHIPFTVWDIGSSTYDDATDDQQLITGGYLPPDFNHFFDYHMQDFYDNDPSSAWLYVRSPMDSLGSYDAFYEDVTSGQYDLQWWDHSKPLFKPLIFLDYDEQGIPPLAGNIIRIISTKNFRAGDRYTIEAPQPEQDVIYNFPQDYRLKQNYPNPFNASTRIEFEIPDYGQVTITIFDVLGRKVRRLEQGYYDRGWHSVTWDGRSDSGIAVSSGVYFYVLQAKGHFSTRKMVVVR